MILRSATADDEHFLRRLFDDVHRPEFAGLDGSVATNLLDLQFRARQAAFSTDHDRAGDHLIVEHDVPVGRIWVDRTTSPWQLVDLAVLAEHQRRGIASTVLAELLRDADQAAVPIALTVRSDNVPAVRLYRRLGFRDESVTVTDLRLVRAPLDPDIT
jgi:ribosomal protein S18 acetylase RimI-like enzyme